MSPYSLSTIASIIKATFVPLIDDTVVVNLLTDSRKIASPLNSLFFAIKGSRNDGHNYIADLYQKGIRSFVVSQEIDFQHYPDASFLKVDNTLYALQLLAKTHRLQFHYPVLAITGSNGKTIVKEWLYQLLHEDKNIVRSPKSYNSQLGVPLSVWLMNDEHQLAILEAGISEPNEMGTLEDIIHPKQGIFTNIGEAHAENFKDKEQKVNEKVKLFVHCDAIFYGKDYVLINEKLTTSDLFKNKNLYTWSKKSKANLQIGSVTKSESNTDIQGVFNNQFIHIKIPFSDEASIENAITCWLYLLVQGYSNETIAERMLELSPVAMRLELKDGINNCSIINDSYNSDLGSLTIALDFLHQQQQHPKKTIILSDIQQSGKADEQLYTEVSNLLAKKNVSKLIGIGSHISSFAHLFQQEKTFYATTADFINQYTHQQFSNETILIKGARSFGFEEISRLIQQKAHETVLEINLNAITHNYNYFKSLIKPQTKIMAMVKAFSYGSGSFEIANLLQFLRVDYLAVAYADEGVELRKAGITLPIMVMNPDTNSFDSMLQYDLEPEIYSFRTLHLLSETLKRWGDKQKRISIHIELDTGMKRLGFDDEDINELIVKLQNNKQITIKSIFSHFVGSDELSLDYFSKQQINLFDKMSEQIKAHFSYPILKHICNSSAIARFADAHFDMVRLGIGLYGIAGSEFEQKKLHNVSTLKTIISQIHLVAHNETVGYNRRGVLTRDSKIATIPIGYADGLPRKLGNGNGAVFIAGKVVPIVGNICMDMCMVDITDLNNVKEGDDVIVFGEELTVNQQAQKWETIPYEVLTSVSRRVKRVYYQE